MPTYDYECPKGHTFEVFQKMTDEPVADCPECGEDARRKISGGAGFLFKGEGFYITDYRSEDYKKKASEEAKPTTKTSDGTSSDSKGGKAKDSAAKSGDKPAKGSASTPSTDA